MPVKYSVIPRKNPLKKDEPAKFYAQIQSNGEEDFKSMTRAVADRCTVTGSDAKAVLDAFTTIMIQRLSNGQIVRLADLGSFRMSATSQGTATEKEFNAAKITKARIIFTPCKELKDMCKAVSFTKTSLIPVPEEGGTGGEGEGEDPSV
ncbi:HU family DNA-binding protein [Bacteroides nordii]|uniref:HU family DNA-binding protein n=1 Tax=Bacteroides nordii TaxID=291645 RepID=UPI000470C846|nr:HU family DNA-binding protein [Bacteroides nordii]UAK42814.1 HU family DNA-binding protein [Bacteroides nordii]